MQLRGMLPVGVSAFVGRARERGQVAALLAEGRVVTVTGPGGCGKTRLAVEVAGDVASRFPDGVRWVDLQGVSEPELVAPAVGQVLGVREGHGQELAVTLAGHVRARHLLVVLDSCEHLVEACADLVAALSSACPHLRVLTTSRVPLGVGGEVTFELPPLEVPHADAPSASAVAAADAARLFEVRARQVAPDFRIGAGNAAAVAEICRRLDGMPLAIELAAARVRVLAPEQIATGLADRFGLLTGGARAAPPRQRSLEASIDWSYDLLDDVHRSALARLSVFAGTFELDAAESVVGAGAIDGDVALDLVSTLVEQSLVQVVQRHGRARYRLLETIRVYASERLPQLEDPDRVRDRHLEFHVGLARRAQAGLSGAQPEPWVARLAADLADLRTAMDRAAQVGDLGALVDITEPITRFWFDCGLSREVHRRLHDAATAPGAPADQRARGLMAATSLALADSEPASAHRSAIHAVDAASAADVGGALATAWGQRALTGALSGLASSAQVAADVERAVRGAERCGDPAAHAYVLAFAGAALLHSRSIDAACDLFEQAVDVCERNDLAFQLPAAHAGAVVWSVWSGQLERSCGHARRAIELSRQVGRPVWESSGLTGLGAAAVLQGDHRRAQERLRQAQAVLRPRALEGSLYGMWVRHWLALSAYGSGDLGAARSAASQIVQIGRGGGSRWDQSIGEWMLGLVAHAEGRGDEARAHLEVGRELSSDPRIPFPLGRSLLGLSLLAAEDDELDRAWELAHDGVDVLHDYADRVGAAAGLEQLADLAVALGDAARGLRLLAASERFHTEAGVARFPDQAERFDRARSRAQTALGAGGAAACWHAGGELQLADAVAYARRGRGERQRPRIGWESLTPVEREVVRLVAAGETNAAIGARLFISANTVKKHLSHVYAKVDVAGRADLAAQVARRGL